jgi:hypothetical protein
VVQAGGLMDLDFIPVGPLAPLGMPLQGRDNGIAR